MSIAFTRGMCRAAVLCLVSAVMTGAIFAQPAAASTAAPNATKHAVVSQKTSLGGETRGLNASTPKTIGGDTLSFAPATEQPMTVVYLHGIHGKAENGCPHLRNG